MKPQSRTARAESLGVDILLIGAFGALVSGIVLLAERWHAPIRTAVDIDLSLTALPGYTLLSLSRGFAAYLLSLAFTLVYGTVAAHSRRAEKVMIPLLDIGQGIPVLGFLPGLVLGMVALFPNTNVGLELACVVMIFTGQVWNMTFSFYGSLRSIPTELGEVARIHRFSWWKRFKTVEVSASVIGLVWNSMMSMAGGWFFLTVNEAFTLGGRDFRLPGIGSYMSVAIEKGDTRATLWAIVAMVLMILAVDQLLWRPLVVWSERFRIEDVAGGARPTSWVVSLVRRSRLLRRLRRLWRVWRRRKTEAAGPSAQAAPVARTEAGPWQAARRGTSLLAAASALGTCAWGGWKLVGLLLRVDGAKWATVALSLLATTGRTALALVLAVLWTVPVGILLGRSQVWSRRMQPVVQTMASFPAPMLYPIVTGALLVFHVPFALVAAILMFLGAQWYVLFNVLAGASAIPHDLDEASDVYRIGGRQRWTTLYLPSVFPFLVTGLVTAAGGAWNASIVAETLVYRGTTLETFGLGTLITKATRDGDFPLLTAGVVTMSVALVALNRTVWRRLYRLAETRFALNR